MRRLNWVWIGFLGCAFALSMPACGDDESSNHGSAGGSGGSSNGSGGSSGGSGGGSGSGGTNASNTTSSSTGGSPSSSQIGTECEQDTDCPISMKCLTSGSNSLSEGGPAHGFCTLACSGDTALDADAECQDVDPNSLCLAFSETKAYCVQRCTFGGTATKCQGRSDVVCDLVIHEAEQSVSCQSSMDCDIGDICLATEDGATEGVCFNTPQVCMPKCSSDGDCPANRFCSPSTGECVDDKPTGKPFGATCDPDAAVDECAGFCNQGICLETCVLGSYPACGSSSNTEATADCLLIAYDEANAAGDVGLCGRLCDCTDECYGGLSCVQIEDDMGPFDWKGRPGICATAPDGTPVLNDCPDMGAGGAAGAGGDGSSL